MNWQTYQEGYDILTRGQKLKNILFIVNGELELGVDDAVGNWHQL